MGSGGVGRMEGRRQRKEGEEREGEGREGRAEMGRAVQSGPWQGRAGEGRDIVQADSKQSLGRIKLDPDLRKS